MMVQTSLIETDCMLATTKIITPFTTISGDLSMSTIGQDGLKTVLERHGIDQMWDVIREHYIQGKPRRARLIAMLSLREVAGWSFEMLADAFGNDRAHIVRSLSSLRRELQEMFELPEDFWTGRHCGR